MSRILRVPIVGFKRFSEAIGRVIQASSLTRRTAPFAIKLMTAHDRAEKAAGRTIREVALEA